MSSVINNSNSNSALVSTLLGSENVVNQNIYSIKEINPPHSLTYATNRPSTSDYRASGVCNFQLNKYGIISQILFNYKKTVNAGETIADNDIFNVISKIDLLSSSRVISTLTSFDLQAQFSNLSTSKLTPILRSGLGSRSAAASGPTTVDYCIPLVFGSGNTNLQLNSSFLEPLSIRVTWNTINKSLTSGGAATGTSGVISEATLNIRYKNYDESQLSKILSENYSQSQLNQLNSRFYDENTVLITATGAVTEMSCELKNTDCCMDFYIIIREVGNTKPIPCKTLLFTGSGQEIMSLNEQQLQYARIDDTDGFSISQDTLTGAAGLYNIAKVQTGGHSNHSVSNLFSLREINSPKITVTFTSEDTKVYEMVVVENTAAIFSTASASGRMDVALSN
jgi:hypothetical protein